MDFGRFIAVFAISGGFAIAALGMWLDSRKRHLRHIERMAMIEKGMAPFDVAGRSVDGSPWAPRHSQRRSGVVMICLGVALGFMLYSQRGGFHSVWVGAFIAMFGVANLVNALLDDRDVQRRQSQSQPPGPPNP